MVKTKDTKSAWKGKSSESKKPWGSVISWSAIKSIGGKIIKIEKGHRTSLKYNTLKDEVLFLISGEITVFTWSHNKTLDKDSEEKFQLLPGDTFNIQSEVPFRIFANKESYIAEISNGKNNKTVRFEDDYGRKCR